MGFWNNIGSVFGSINTPNVENDTTYQRYQKEIKNFNLDTPSNLISLPNLIILLKRIMSLMNLMTSKH